MRLTILLLGILCLLTSCGKKKPITQQYKDKSHDEIMSAIDLPSHPIKNIGILVYDGVNDLDLTGPRYVLKSLMGVSVQMIAVKPGTITTVMGMQILPDTTMDQVNNLDILVIPGGATETVKLSYNQKVLDWIKMIDEHTVYTTSVCTGGWILGKTGLLSGKKATGNWFRAKEILAANGAQFVNKRYVKDGKYWTSAGVTAGMDMSLAIMNELVGPEYTQGVMLDMEYDPNPPIKGGSVKNTDAAVLELMNQMYSSMVDPILEEKEHN
jgi:putative intracellular protease/amidase